jgi:hypothetical protein
MKSEDTTKVTSYLGPIREIRRFGDRMQEALDAIRFKNTMDILEPRRSLKEEMKQFGIGSHVQSDQVEIFKDRQVNLQQGSGISVEDLAEVNGTIELNSEVNAPILKRYASPSNVDYSLPLNPETDDFYENYYIDENNKLWAQTGEWKAFALNPDAWEFVGDAPEGVTEGRKILHIDSADGLTRVFEQREVQQGLSGSVSGLGNDVPRGSDNVEASRFAGLAGSDAGLNKMQTGNVTPEEAGAMGDVLLVYDGSFIEGQGGTINEIPYIVVHVMNPLGENVITSGDVRIAAFADEPSANGIIYRPLNSEGVVMPDYSVELARGKWRAIRVPPEMQALAPQPLTDQIFGNNLESLIERYQARNIFDNNEGDIDRDLIQRYMDAPSKINTSDPNWTQIRPSSGGAVFSNFGTLFMPYTDKGRAFHDEYLSKIHDA